MKNMYWEYAGTRYTQKFKAIEAAGSRSSSIQFNIFDDTFHNFNWLVEPSQSFQELCDLRAFQLRDQYSYIKLYFSGGCDSTTVLNTFLRNNIHIDEIVCYRYSPIDNFDCLSNLEVNEFAIPFLQSLNLPKTKIKILDHGSDYFKNLLEDDKFFYKKNSIDLREYHLPKIRGKNFCHLFGDSDPIIEKHDDKWYEVIYDLTCYGEHRFRNMEMFFTSPNLPELHAKQCHLVKNYIKKNPVYPNYKDVVRIAARDTSINKTPAFLKKFNMEYKGFDVMPKNTLMLKNSTEEILRNYKGVLGTKFKGFKLLTIYDGIRGKKYCLGE